MYHFENNPHENIASTLIEDNEFEAKEISQSGDFYLIKEKLSNKGLLEIEKNNLVKKYEIFFNKIDFLTEQDLEMLTILDLYDEKLVVHSLETYRIAKEKIEKVLAFNIRLVDLIENEQVKPEQLFRACLLHDIGKVEIPNFIINNIVNNQEMDLLLRDLVLDKKDNVIVQKIEEIIGKPENISNEEELTQIKNENHLRAVHLIPVKHFLSEAELKILSERNINSDLTLMEIIKTHEEASRSILEKANLPVESALAGSHHNYHNEGSSYLFSIDTLHLSVDMAELVRMADITEALTASRSYNQNGFSLPRVLKIILEEVKIGKINPKIAYLWIEDEIKTLDNNPSDNLTPDDLQDIKFIRQELKAIYQTITENSFTK